MIELLTESTFFGQLLIGGLTAATGCVAYFARQIMKNQRDLMIVHLEVIKLSEEVNLIKGLLQENEKEQRRIHEDISLDIERLRTIYSLASHPWDGVDRRKNY